MGHCGSDTNRRRSSARHCGAQETNGRRWSNAGHCWLDVLDGGAFVLRLTRKEGELFSRGEHKNFVSGNLEPKWPRSVLDTTLRRKSLSTNSEDQLAQRKATTGGLTLGSTTPGVSATPRALEHSPGTPGTDAKNAKVTKMRHICKKDCAYLSLLRNW